VALVVLLLVVVGVVVWQVTKDDGAKKSAGEQT
jgi:hypothetical protein